MKKFRLLRPDEIECRVSRVSEKGVVLLLYKTARTDADLLDETVGSENWENDFRVIDGVLYGGICINGMWKWDAGTESNTEAEKGRASDAFKRAGFKWGIGRELYSAPFTFIPAGKCTIKNNNGRLACYDEFEVASITYDAQERISSLVITLKGVPVFEWGNPNPPPTDPNVYICADCGRPILDGRKRNGEKWYAKDIAFYTKQSYGRPLCSICATEAKKNAGKTS